MSQESYIRVKSQAVRVNAGQFIMRIASERGGPRYAVSLAVTPSQVRLAEADRAALARVHGDCCPGAAVYAGGPCKALGDALKAASAPLAPEAAAGSLCHVDASLCDAAGHLLELVLRNPTPGTPGLRCPGLSGGFAAFPLLERLTMDGSELGGDAEAAARALAPAPALEWVALRGAGLGGRLTCGLLLRGVRVLDVSDNKLEGPVPGCFFDNAHLMHLYAANNRLGGALPAIGAQTALYFVSLAGQAPPGVDGAAGFTALPPNLAAAANMSFLDVAQSRIAGQVGSLNDNLRFLNVSHNQLTGPLPKLPAALTHFDASLNNFTGGLPSDLSSAASLMVLNVSQNPALGPTRLPSTLPPALRALSAARIGLEGPLEATALPDSLARIDLADNRLEGKLPGLAGAVDVILLEA
ncbi:hypothetical protein MNEG_14300, partial [Monoraphidium neglectum]